MRSGDARSWILTGKVTLLCRCVSGDSRAEHASGSAVFVSSRWPEPAALAREKSRKYQEIGEAVVHGGGELSF